MVGGLYCVVEFVESSRACGGGNNAGNVAGKIDAGGGQSWALREILDDRQAKNVREAIGVYLDGQKRLWTRMRVRRSRPRKREQRGCSLGR